MARWRLTEPHYLKVPGTKWEYSEVDRITGRPKRTQYDVPLYINPHADDDQKSFGQGPLREDIFVCWEGSEQNSKDVVFSGPPTLGMAPVDDEAKEITAKYEKQWNHSVTDGLGPESQNQSYTADLLSGLIDAMTEARTSVQAAPQVAGMEDFMKTMSAMMAQQTAILAKLAGVEKEGVENGEASRIQSSAVEDRSEVRNQSEAGRSNLSGRHPPRFPRREAGQPTA